MVRMGGCGGLTSDSKRSFPAGLCWLSPLCPGGKSLVRQTVAWAVSVVCLVGFLAGPAIAASLGPSGTTGISLGQGLTSGHDVGLSPDYFLSYGPDLARVVISPVKWTPSDWVRFMAVASLASAVADRDTDIQAWIQRNRTKGMDRLARIGEPLGNGRYVLPTLGLTYCYGRIFGDERAQRASLLSIESVLVSGAVTGGIKYLAHKRRPFETAPGEDDIPWSGPGLNSKDVSFPSGHTTIAFAVATVMATEYKDHRLVRPLVYTAASLVGFSRLNSNSHWLSDVIMGAAIGHFTARAIESIHGGDGDKSLSLAPVLDRNQVGVSLAVKF